jgi:hypothetical protein
MSVVTRNLLEHRIGVLLVIITVIVFWLVI